MRTAPGPSWTKCAPRATTLEEPQPEAAQGQSQSQPQPESQEEPKASQPEGGDGSGDDRATTMAETDAAMQNGQTTDELRDTLNDFNKTVNAQPGPKPKNEEGKNAADSENQRKKESPAQLEGQSKIDDVLSAYWVAVPGQATAWTPVRRCSTPGLGALVG